MLVLIQKDMLYYLHSFVYKDSLQIEVILYVHNSIGFLHMNQMLVILILILCRQAILELSLLLCYLLYIPEAF